MPAFDPAIRGALLDIADGSGNVTDDIVLGAEDAMEDEIGGAICEENDAPVPILGGGLKPIILGVCCTLGEPKSELSLK